MWSPTEILCDMWCFCFRINRNVQQKDGETEVLQRIWFIVQFLGQHSGQNELSVVDVWNKNITDVILTKLHWGYADKTQNNTAFYFSSSACEQKHCNTLAAPTGGDNETIKIQRQQNSTGIYFSILKFNLAWFWIFVLNSTKCWTLVKISPQDRLCVCMAHQCFSWNTLCRGADHFHRKLRWSQEGSATERKQLSGPPQLMWCSHT